MYNFIKNKEPIENIQGFDKHRLVSFVYDEKSGLRGFIAIHRGGLRYSAFGATRIWPYETEEEALRDALKLSRTMSYKSALAGLKYGGAKAVIISNEAVLKNKEQLLEAYAKKVNYFSGHFVTGADVGTTGKDVQILKKYSPYIVGTKVDPVKFTINGIFQSMQTCLREIYGNDKLENRSFAIKGLGKVGFGLLEKIGDKASKIYVADIDKNRLKEAKNKFNNLEIVEPLEIEKQPVDVFSPNALSNCINGQNISKLRCKIIVGGANCQLENSSIGELLYKLGILYAPDYVVNAGGLISVVDEYEHKDYDEERINLRVNKIKTTLKNIFSQSKKQKKATNLVADEMAQQISDSIR